MNPVNLKKRVCVGLSGGVDSAVSAYLLKKKGYEVHGLFMYNWQDGHCPATDDMKSARQVAQTLGIEFDIVDLSQNYWELVFQKFLQELSLGVTPNPDILCNEYIKFAVFKKIALERCDIMATGHYARINKMGDDYALMQPADIKKDQTYFLCRLSQKHLSKVLFPLEGSMKKDIKKIAQEIGLPNYNRKESMGICFIGQDKLAPFLSEYLLDKPGDITDDQGHTIGQHKGLFYYTLGQRKGLMIGGKKDMSEAPFYVIDKQLSTNTLIVSQNQFDKKLLSDEVTVTMLHAIRDPFVTQRHIYARIRHQQALQKCQIIDTDETKTIVKFHIPQRAATPGQYIAFYKDGECLGSGKIDYHDA